MRPFARKNQGERGAATTEFALVSLLLVPTLLYSIFFYEMSLTRLKANEASRFLVWEMTAYGLSDFKEGDHEKKFKTARQEILDEVKERYGDGDLDGATPTLVKDYKAHAFLALETSVDTAQVDITDGEPGIYAIDGFDALDDIVNYVFGFWKFNKQGKPVGKFKIHAKNKLLGKLMPIGYTEKMLEKDEFDIPSSQSIIADQWDVKDGAAMAHIAGITCDADGKPACPDYFAQIKRMHLAGLTNLMGGDSVENALGKISGAVGVHLPLLAVGVSQPLSGSNTSEVSLTVSAENMKCHSHQPVRTGMTNVYKDTYKKEDSRYYKLYQKLGPCYMGCDEPLKQEAGDNACSYNSRNTDTECK